MVGVDLFQWARDSTAELQGEPAPSQHAASQGPDAVTHGPEAEAALLFPASAALAQAPPLAPCAAAAGPLLQLWSMQGQLLVDGACSASLQRALPRASPRASCAAVSPQQMHPLRVPFEADAGCEARAVVRAANVGSTALFYQWQRQEVVVSLQAGVPRAGAGRDGVRRFFCSDLSGVLLPGDVRDFVITFRSAAAGVFREGWELATTPHANGAPSLQVQLSGAAVAVDENSAARRQLQAELHERAARYGVQELVWDMVERVRTPPPPPEPEQVERLQRETFEAQNPGLIYGREVFAELEALALRVLQHHGLAEDDARWDACVGSLQELARYLPPATPPATPAPAPPPTPPAAAAPPRTAEGRSPRSQRAKESPRTSPRPQQSPPPAGDSAVDEPPAAAPAAPLPSAGWSLPSASVPLRAEPVLARVAHLRECARQRPPEASPLYALARECLLAVAEQVPVAADAARVAQGLEPVAWEAPAQPVEDTAERRERRERLLEMLQRMDAEEAAEEEETAGRGKSRGKGKPARAAVGSAGKGGSRTRRAAGGEQDKLAAYLQHFRMRLFGALGDAAEQFAGSSEDALRRTRAAELAARGMSLSDRVAAADVEVAGKVVLLRADLDVELASEAAGATVAEAGLPLVDACARSVRELLQRGARKVLLLAHRGMPPVCRPPAEAEEEEEEEEQQRRLQQLEQQAAAAGAESKVTARSSSASSSSSSAATGGAATRDAHADLAGVDDEVRARFTLRPVAEALETALEEPVAFVPDAVGPAALQLLQGLHRQEAARRRKAERKEAEARRAEAKSSADDDDDEAEAEEEDEEEEEEEGARVVLLENLRFHWEEMEEERLAQARAAEEVQRSAQAAWARQERDGRREARWERREAGETGVESDTEDDSDADSVFSDHARRRAQATRAARAAAWEARFRLPPAVARFRHALARLGDVVLVDAFEASAARASSTHGLAALLAAPPAPEAAAEPAERGVDATQADTTRALLALPAARQVAAGPQLRQHLHSLARVLEHPSPPVVALLGGSARAHKFQLLLALLEVAAEVVVTGEVGVALLHCLRGVPVGDSLERLDAQPLRQAAAAVEHKARRHGARLVLPVDLVACSERPSLRGQGGEDELLTAELQEVQAQPWAGVPAGWYALDVGPHTVALAKQAAERAGTCVFVGVAGAVESSEFQEGTLGLLQALRAARAAGAFVFAGTCRRRPRSLCAADVPRVCVCVLAQLGHTHRLGSRSWRERMPSRLSPAGMLPFDSCPAARCLAWQRCPASRTRCSWTKRVRVARTLLRAPREGSRSGSGTSARQTCRWRIS